MIYARTTIIRWIVIYLSIVDPEYVDSLAIAERRGLIPYSNAFDLIYSGN